MKRALVHCLLAGIVGLAGAADSPAQEAHTPGGYLFFARRNRPTPTAWTRVAEPTSAKSANREAPCCKISDEVLAPRSPIPPQPEAAPATTDHPSVHQVTWGTEFGLGYGWPVEGYYPGMPNYGFGRPIAYPLHAYRATYEWAGHTYSIHCYCAEGYCPHHCPGYRGACYVPCWNDAGTPIIERRCGRGSAFDGFWHMGGYERRCRTTDCPYVCSGPPAFDSFGFPRGAAGDPNYRQPRGARAGEQWRRSHDPYGPAPAAKPLPTPVKPPVLPNPVIDPSEAPVPMPQR